MPEIRPRSSKRANEKAPQNESEKDVVSYWFLGKIALFPVFMMLLAGGAVGIFTFRSGLLNENPTGQGPGWFTTGDLTYGLVGLLLSVICLIMLAFFLFWLVIKVTFTFDPELGVFTVTKRGIFRKSVLEFDMSDISFHYFRTHFAESKRWLQFVVREGDIYFQLYSWRGKGSQTETFLKLFQQLQDHLARAQAQMLIPIHPRSKPPIEIVSKEEFTLIGPFTSRLTGFVARQHTSNVPKTKLPKGVSPPVPDSVHGSRAYPPRSKEKMPKSMHHLSQSKQRHLDNRTWYTNDDTTSSICEEQIAMIDYDSLLRHFRYEKRLDAPIMPGEIRGEQSELASEMVRKA